MSSQPVVAVPAHTCRLNNPIRLFAALWVAAPAVLAPAAMISGNYGVLWFVPLLWCAIVPVLDQLLPRAVDAVEVSHADDQGGSGLLRLFGFALLLDVLALAWLCAQGELPLHAILGAGLSLAFMLATVALNVRCLQPSPHAFDVAPAALLSGFLGGGIYRRAITVDHQRAVATQNDPFSARMGEGFWTYSYRATAGLLALAWGRIRHDGVLHHVAAPDSAESSMLYELLFAALTLAGFVIWAGYDLLVILTIAWIGAVIVVLAAHYVQHYGLLRAKRSDGAHVRPGALHAWDDAHQASAWLLFNASHHAHAHLAPRQHYASLTCLAGAPKLPYGQVDAILLAMFPPAWFAVMDPRVAAWAEGDLQRTNIDGDAYAMLMARYHRPA